MGREVAVAASVALGVEALAAAWATHSKFAVNYAAARRRMVSPPAIARHADPRLKSPFFLSVRSR